MDSNQRRRKPAGLQPAPFGHSGNPPGIFVHQITYLLTLLSRAGEGTRTPNPLLTKQELYQLSYTSKVVELEAEASFQTPSPVLVTKTSDEPRRTVGLVLDTLCDNRKVLGGGLLAVSTNSVKQISVIPE